MRHRSLPPYELRHPLLLTLLAGSTLTGTTLLLLGGATASESQPPHPLTLISATLQPSCTQPSPNGQTLPAPDSPAIFQGVNPHRNEGQLLASANGKLEGTRLVSTDRSGESMGQPNPGLITEYPESPNESPILDFTAAESDAAVALFGCDCPACLNSLRQLTSRSLVEQLSLNGTTTGTTSVDPAIQGDRLIAGNPVQGHCWAALQRRSSPQEIEDVLRQLEAGES